MLCKTHSKIDAEEISKIEIKSSYLKVGVKGICVSKFRGNSVVLRITVRDNQAVVKEESFGLVGVKMTKE